MPYRVPAPPEPDRGPDADEIAYARRLARLRYGTTVRLVTAVAVAAAAVAAIAVRAPKRPTCILRPNKTAAKAAVLLATRERAGEAQRKFVAAVQSAVASPPSDTPCMIALPAPSSLAKSRRTLPLVIVREDDVRAGNVTSPHVSSALADVVRAESSLARGRALALPSRERSTELVVVARTLVEPRATGSTTYEPGRLEGRVYAYDPRSGKVVCSAPVRAESSETVGYSYANAFDVPAWLGRNARLDDSLEADFRYAVEDAALRSLTSH